MLPRKRRLRATRSLLIPPYIIELSRKVHDTGGSTQYAVRPYCVLRTPLLAKSCQVTGTFARISPEIERRSKCRSPIRDKLLVHPSRLYEVTRLTICAKLSDMSTHSAHTREFTLRESICEAGRRMKAQGLAPGSDGNLSARLDEERILITASGFDKGFLKPDDLLTVNLAGELIPSVRQGRQHLKPSSETDMHLEVYRRRPDVQAVIHAHPPMAIACTVAGIRLDQSVLPEVIYHLGVIPTAPYATPGTPEGADAIRELVQDYNAILLDRHGALTLGVDIFQALMRMEWVEQAAKVVLAASSVGVVSGLPEEAIQRLYSIRHGKTAMSADAELVRQITAAVLRRLTERGKT
ncbi:MAG: class II aldolase/adducin family protein [Anaerolineae bacterium]